MGYLQAAQAVLRNCFGDRPHLALQKAEAGVFPVFEAALKEQLHPEADPEKRYPLSRGLFYHVAEAGLRELAGGVPEGPDAGQDDPVGAHDHAAVGRHGGLLADRPEGRAEREEVADAVIDYRRHQSTPFVEGISPPSAGSTDTAARRLRAADLNAPSMMW